MSTTWVFLGLLAGRELGMWLRARHYSGRELKGFVSRDLGKAAFGTTISVAVAFGVPYAAAKLGASQSANPRPTAISSWMRQSVDPPV